VLTAEHHMGGNNAQESGEPAAFVFVHQRREIVVAAAEDAFAVGAQAPHVWALAVAVDPAPEPHQRGNIPGPERAQAPRAGGRLAGRRQAGWGDRVPAPFWLAWHLAYTKPPTAASEPRLRSVIS